MTRTKGPDIAWPMAVLTSLFFMWGFMTVMNDVLVPHLKQVFALDYSVGLLVQSFFFGAYFTGSLLYYWLSHRSGDLRSSASATKRD